MLRQHEKRIGNEACEVGGVFEAYRWPGSGSSFTAIDALGGFRYWNNSIDASFDVALEGPMVGIWFWCLFGFGIASSMIYRWERAGRLPVMHR